MSTANTTRVSKAHLLFAVALAALGTSSVVAACGGDNSSSSSGGNNGDGGSGVSSTPGSCATSTLGIVFSPMYSAYIPGSTMHTFQIPAVLDDGSTATWSLSDPSQAQLAVQTFDGVSGVMITLQGLGTNGAVDVIATKSDGTCGKATLDITAATEDDWSIGNARYNDGVSLSFGPRDGGGFPEGGFEGGRPDGGRDGGPRTSDGGSFFEEDGGTACTNCHGPTATNGPFKDVSHTPEQTGGFSDDDLVQIIIKGEVPDGGYFDPAVINPSCDGGPCTARAYQQWSSFHQWTDIQPDQYKGIVVYLRSLTPASQAGTSNFGGRGRDGGRGGRDGG